MKRVRYCSLFTVVSLLYGLFVLAGCLKDSPAEVNLEIPVFDTEGLIGPAGGVVKIMDKNSPIYGCYVAIKEDALDTQVKISIRQVGSPDSNMSAAGRIFVEFLPAGTRFKKPAEIGIVYQSGNIDSLQQFVYDSDLKEWLPLPFRRIDLQARLVVGLTPHFSTYTVSDHAKRDIIFADHGLEEAVRETAGLYDGETISLGDVYYLAGMDAAKFNIRDLNGIMYLKNLTKLDLSENKISSLQPLALNRNLQIVALNDNQIADLSPLSGLVNLTVTTLDHNQISNLTPLIPLQKLKSISLDNNQISNLNPLSYMPQLENLTLYHNQIKDMTPLTVLTKLKGLEIDHNQITFIPLLHNLSRLSSIKLGNNPISDPSNLATARQLQSIELDSCQITHFPDLPGLDSLKSLSAKFNRINSLGTFHGLKNLQYLALMGNQLTGISPLYPLTRLQTLDLDDNLLEGTLKLSTLTKLSTVSLVNNRLNYYLLPPFNIPVNDLSELPHLTELNTIYLDKNRLLGLGNLQNLTKLTTITLDKNYSSKFKTGLYDISALGALNKIKYVSARHNSISNIYCFDDKMSLQHLDLDTNAISDLLPLGKNYAIQYLSLDGNQIQEIALLLGNPGLDYGDRLNLRHNPLSNSAIHEHIPVLTDRGVKVKWTITRPEKPALGSYTERRERLDQQISTISRRFSPRLQIRMAVHGL